MEDKSYPPTMELLKDLGDPRDSWKWAEGGRNYVEELGLTAEHVPDLIQIARFWNDWFIAGGTEPDKPMLWAPIHAWRALGQLQAAEATQPLLDMMEGLQEYGDDWHMEEFPDVFSMIGPDTITPLFRHLCNTELDVYTRIVSANSLCRLVKRSPECRNQVVLTFGSLLSESQQNPSELNSFLIAYLLELKAVEQAETIEHAFAADQVDYDICGFWGEVRRELGVEGMGLAPDMPPSPKKHHDQFLRFDPPESIDKRERIRLRKRKEKQKAKLKQRQKAQKRNRRKK